MTMEQHREIVYQLYLKATNRKYDEMIDKSSAHSFTPYTVSAKPSSLKAFNHFFSAVSAAFPDYELYIDNLVSKEDKVMVRYTISGTQKGIFMGMAPTNERMTITGIDIFRLDKGKVVRHWDAAHQVCALPQSGKLPAAPLKNWRPGSLITSAANQKELSFST